jgi:hypothetical protein
MFGMSDGCTQNFKYENPKRRNHFAGSSKIGGIILIFMV